MVVYIGEVDVVCGVAYCGVAYLYIVEEGYSPLPSRCLAFALLIPVFSSSFPQREHSPNRALEASSRTALPNRAMASPNPAQV